MVSRLARAQVQAQRAQVHQEPERPSLPPESLSAPTARRRRRSKNLAPASVPTQQMCNFFSKTIGFFTLSETWPDFSAKRGGDKGTPRSKKTERACSRARREHETGKCGAFCVRLSADARR